MSRLSLEFTSLVALVVIFVSICFTAFRIQRVEASGTIYILADGSVEGTDKIITADNITYTFTDNINDSIVIERNNIVVDGVGYTLQGTGSGTGFNCSSINNVTIKNTNIKNFTYGIYLYASSHNTILGNNITHNANHGIELYFISNNNTVSRNDISENGMYGIWLYESSNNTLSENNITTNKAFGIYLLFSFNNLFYHNNLINNAVQVRTYDSYSNVWDDGYPSGGNFWSGYIGFDANYDGIGDASYIIDAYDIDGYPLMGMFSSFNTSYGYAVDFVSNSSISDFSFNLSSIEVYPPEAILAFNVSGDASTEGFLRICIPKILINGSYVIRFDGEIITNTTYPQARELSCSNETYEYLYINYTHSEHSLIITGTTVIPEFPSFLILPLFMIATLLAVIVCRKKRISTR